MAESERKHTPWRVEGAPPPDPEKPDEPTRPRFRLPGGRGFFVALLLLFAVNWYIGTQVNREKTRVDVPYTTFRAQVTQGNVKEISTKGDTIQGKFRTAVKQGKTSSKDFDTVRPSFGNDGLLDLLINKNVVVNAHPVDEGTSFLVTLLISFGPTILLVGLFILLMRRAAGGPAGLSGIGRTRAKRYDASQQRTTFDDVAGIDEVEDELVEIVDFLRDPEVPPAGRDDAQGRAADGPARHGQDPAGRAVAGEANVPFFSRLGVGVHRDDRRRRGEPGARPVPAGQQVGARRSSSSTRSTPSGARAAAATSIGGHDEREQTLNQILTEMDGFTGIRGRHRVAATNRPEILDPALLRPGRFDRRVAVNPPDQEGRREILRGPHARRAARRRRGPRRGRAATPGMIGRGPAQPGQRGGAARRRARARSRSRTADFADALEKISPRGRAQDHAPARTSAAHRLPRVRATRCSGMLAARRRPGEQGLDHPARAGARRHASRRPTPTATATTRRYLRGRIVGALGGRAAEEIVYGDVTTGAENDLEQVTTIARGMVGRWGMSDKVGPCPSCPARATASPFPARRVARHPRPWTTRCGGSWTSATSARESLLRENREKLDAARRGAAGARDARRGRRLPRRRIRSTAAQRR